MVRVRRGQEGLEARLRRALGLGLGVWLGLGLGLGLGLAKVPSVTLWPSMIACARQHSWPARSLPVLW